MNIVIVALVALGLFVPPKPLLVDGYDPGGNVGTYIGWWDRVADSGMEVAIQGACVSACVLFTGIIPVEKVCVTENALLGLHEATTENEDGSMAPDPTVTKLMVSVYYPSWLQEWIKANAPNGVLGQDMIYVESEELLKHYKHC